MKLRTREIKLSPNCVNHLNHSKTGKNAQTNEIDEGQKKSARKARALLQPASNHVVQSASANSTIKQEESTDVRSLPQDGAFRRPRKVRCDPESIKQVKQEDTTKTETLLKTIAGN